MAFGFACIGVMLNKIIDLVSFRPVLDNVLDLFAFGADDLLFEIGLDVLFELQFLGRDLGEFGFDVLGGVMGVNHWFVVWRFDNIAAAGV
jgi:hypothetical protein